MWERVCQLLPAASASVWQFQLFHCHLAARSQGSLASGMGAPHLCTGEARSVRCLPPSTGEDPPRASIISTLFAPLPGILAPRHSLLFPQEVSFLNTSTSLTVQLVFQVIFHFLSMTFLHETFPTSPCTGSVSDHLHLSKLPFCFPFFPSSCFHIKRQKSAQAFATDLLHKT